MRLIRATLGFLFLLFALAVSGCGDQQDSRLSNEDVAYLKMRQLQNQYGLSTSATTTVMSVVTVTATAVNYTTVGAPATVVPAPTQAPVVY